MCQTRRSGIFFDKNIRPGRTKERLSVHPRPYLSHEIPEKSSRLGPRSELREGRLNLGQFECGDIIDLKNKWFGQRGPDEKWGGFWRKGKGFLQQAVLVLDEEDSLVLGGWIENSVQED